LTAAPVDTFYEFGKRGRAFMSLVFWFLTPILGIAAILISRFLTGHPLFDVASYSGALSSFYFIAISISVAAFAEAIELAMLSPPTQGNGKLGTSIAVQFVVNLVFFLGVFALYFNAVKSEISVHMITPSDLGYAVFFLAIALLLGVLMRSQLEKARG
jgi:hypothetical protein